MTPLQIYFRRTKHVNGVPRMLRFATHDVEYFKPSKVVSFESDNGLIYWHPVPVTDKPNWARIERKLGPIHESLRKYLTEYYWLEIEGQYNGWHCLLHTYDGHQTAGEFLKTHKTANGFELGYCSSKENSGALVFDTKFNQCLCMNHKGIHTIVGSIEDILSNMIPDKKITYIEITDGSGCSGYFPNI